MLRRWRRQIFISTIFILPSNGRPLDLNAIINLNHTLIVHVLMAQRCVAWLWQIEIIYNLTGFLYHLRLLHWCVHFGMNQTLRPRVISMSVLILVFVFLKEFEPIRSVFEMAADGRCSFLHLTHLSAHLVLLGHAWIMIWFNIIIMLFHWHRCWVVICFRF